MVDSIMHVRRRLVGLAAGLCLGLGALSGASAQAISVVKLADQPGAEVDYAAIWVAEALGYYEQE